MFEEVDVAVVGSGVSCLALIRRILEIQSDFYSKNVVKKISIFEKSGNFGSGIPYSNNVDNACLMNAGYSDIVSYSHFVKWARQYGIDNMILPPFSRHLKLGGLFL